MQLVKKIAAVGLTVLLSIVANAAPQHDQNAANQLNELLQNSQRFRANFTQTLTKPKAGKTEHYQGHFSLSRPNRFNWKVTSPDKQLLVADGKNLWFYDEDLEQVTVSPLQESIGNTPAVLLSSSTVDIEKQFYVIKSKDSGKDLEFTLNPKRSDQLISEVRLGFNDKRLNSMMFLDTMGQRSNIKFSNVEMNPRLPASLFVFTVPKGVDVIGKPR